MYKTKDIVFKSEDGCQGSSKHVRLKARLPAQPFYHLGEIDD